MNGVAPQDPEARLNSWKEISGYLNRTIRTAQRWERTEALPVHRHSHDKRDSVYAYQAELDRWWAARRSRLGEGKQPEISTVSGGARRWWATAGTLMLLSVVLLAWLSRRHPPLEFKPRDWVLITDFDNQTGDPLLDKGLWIAFTAGFRQSAHANVLPGTQIEAALKRMGRNAGTRIDEPLGREICLRENVRGLITCGIARDGPGYLVLVRLVDPKTGETVRSYVDHVKHKELIIRSLGDLAGRIRADLGESLAAIRQDGRRLPELTTASLEALKLYADGRYLWQKGQYGQAIRLFEAALEDDPDFAMAHASLGNAYFSPVYSDPVRGSDHYRKALERPERLTDRERLYIRATFAGNQGHFREALELFQAYLGSFPDDAAAHYRLGNVWMQNNRFPEAIREFQAAVRLDPTSARAYAGMAAARLQMGDVAHALSGYAKALELEPSWLTLAKLNHEYGFALVQSGNRPRARDVFSTALGRPETQAGALRSLALLDLYEGRYRSARTRLRESIMLSQSQQRSRDVARNRLLLSELLADGGDRKGAVAELDRAAQSLQAAGAPQNLLAVRVAVKYARFGAIDKAENMLRALRGRVDGENPNEVSELYRLEGETALVRGDPERALESLTLAAQQADNPLTAESLAHAYERLGDTARAVAWYERLAAMGYRALGWEPQQSWFKARIYLSAAYLARGDCARAAAALDGLSALWKEAGMDSPLVRSLSKIERALER